MRRSLLLAALLVVLAGIGWRFLSSPSAVPPGGPLTSVPGGAAPASATPGSGPTAPATAQPSAAPENFTNTSPRPLTPVEDAQFLGLVCAPLPAATAPVSGYAHSCGKLAGNADASPVANGITFTSIMYGHFTNATASQAYVSYQGSFESHATNFGGGVLFNKTATGWAPGGWYAGGQMDECVSLTPGGQAKMLCLSGSTGQGEVTSWLSVQTIPPNPGADGPQYHVAVLRADDARQTMNPNANCNQLKAPGQAVLLWLGRLAPAPAPAPAPAGAGAGAGAVASVRAVYVAPAAASSACLGGRFADAPTSEANLQIFWNGHAISLRPALDFAPAGW